MPTTKPTFTVPVPNPEPGPGSKSGPGPADVLIIADWEFLHAERILTVYLDHLIAAGHSFSEIMDSVDDEAVRDGDQGIAASCAAFAEKMTSIVGKIQDIQFSLQGRADRLITIIDSIDRFVY